MHLLICLSDCPFSEIKVVFEIHEKRSTSTNYFHSLIQLYHKNSNARVYFSVTIKFNSLSLYLCVFRFQEIRNSHIFFLELQIVRENVCVQSVFNVGRNRHGHFDQKTYWSFEIFCTSGNAHSSRYIATSRKRPTVPETHTYVDAEWFIR